MLKNLIDAYSDKFCVLQETWRISTLEAPERT